MASLWASEMGSGMSSGVSSQAKPNIMPWSPAPMASTSASLISPCLASSARSTPSAMSADCLSIDVITAQASQSNPYLALVYPMSRSTPRAISAMSMWAVVEISPITEIRPVVAVTSQAQREAGSCSSSASSTASEI